MPRVGVTVSVKFATQTRLLTCSSNFYGDEAKGSISVTPAGQVECYSKYYIEAKAGAHSKIQSITIVDVIESGGGSKPDKIIESKPTIPPDNNKVFYGEYDLTLYDVRIKAEFAATGAFFYDEENNENVIYKCNYPMNSFIAEGSEVVVTALVPDGYSFEKFDYEYSDNPTDSDQDFGTVTEDGV